MLLQVAPVAAILWRTVGTDKGKAAGQLRTDPVELHGFVVAARQASEWRDWGRPRLLWELVKKYNPLLSWLYPSLQLDCCMRALFFGIGSVGLSRKHLERSGGWEFDSFVTRGFDKGAFGTSGARPVSRL